MTRPELASRIDHTTLKPEATPAEVHRVLTEAIQNGFASVCVSPIYVARVAQALRGSETRIPCCTVIGFPHGSHKPTVKAIEATSAIKDGAEEIDVVAHLPHVMNADVDALKYELMEIVRAARATRSDVVIKVIVESSLLTANGLELGEKRIAAACRAVRESGCDFIKTSTGFHPSGGASVEAVRLMKKHAGGIQIKASGGIRDITTAMAMFEAGADRIGCSSSVALLLEHAKLSDVEGRS